MKHLGTVEIVTERLILRKFNKNDLSSMFKNWEQDEITCKYLKWKPTSFKESKKCLYTWISNYKYKNFYQWAIVLKEINEPIGTIHLFNIDETANKVEFGFCIGSKWFHKGYTSEAVKCLLPFLFNKVGVNKIVGCNNVENKFSGLVFKKCGFKLEGTFKQDRLRNGVLIDVEFRAMLKEDFLKKNKSF